MKYTKILILFAALCTAAGCPTPDVIDTNDVNEAFPPEEDELFEKGS